MNKNRQIKYIRNKQIKNRYEINTQIDRKIDKNK